MGWRSGAERACARRWRCHRCPPARLLPGVAAGACELSTGVGMRMICDVNWDTHRAHTHVYRSTTDATTHRDPVGFVSTSLSVHRAALSASHNATTSLLGQRPAFKSPRHRGTSRVQGVAFNTLLGLPRFATGLCATS